MVINPKSGPNQKNKSSTFLSGYCTPQEGYIEPFIPAASCGVFWKDLRDGSTKTEGRKSGCQQKRSLSEAFVGPPAIASLKLGSVARGGYNLIYDTRRSKNRQSCCFRHGGETRGAGQISAKTRGQLSGD